MKLFGSYESLICPTPRTKDKEKKEYISEENEKEKKKFCHTSLFSIHCPRAEVLNCKGKEVISEKKRKEVKRNEEK